MSENTEQPAPAQPSAEKADHVAVDPQAEPTAPVEAAPSAAADDASDDDSITERYRVPEDLFTNLKSIGYSDNAIKKSIVAGCIDEKTCTAWLDMHLDHPELNTDLEPHIRVKIVKKRVLTDEERAAKVEELKAKIAEKKKRDEEEAKRKETEDAKRRMHDGKAALIAKEEREKIQRQLDYEQRRKEKLADIAAREKLQIDLAVDRLVRGGTERTAAEQQVLKEFEEKKKQVAEEKKRRATEAQARREAAPTSAAAEEQSQPTAGGWNLAHLVGPSESELASGGGPAAPASATGAGSVVIDFDRDEQTSHSPTAATFADILQRSDAKLPRSDPRAATGREILRKVLAAIVAAPMDRRVRTLKVTSNVFTQKIYPMPLSCLFLRQAGFQETASLPELEAAGANDQLTMHFCVLPRVRAALEALNA